MLRSFVLQQVPLTATAEPSIAFTIVLVTMIVVTLTIGGAARIRLRQSRKTE